MKRLFISQPMNGLTEDEILDARSKAIADAENILGECVEVVESYFTDFDSEGKAPLWFLGRALEALSTADVAYFAPGWKQSRGCVVEHICCVNYGISTLEDGVTV